MTSTTPRHAGPRSCARRPQSHHLVPVRALTGRDGWPAPQIHQEDVRQRSDLRNMRRAFGRWSITFCVGGCRCSDQPTAASPAA